MKKEIIEIGNNYIVSKIGRWIYTERGLFIEDIIKQLKLTKESSIKSIGIDISMDGTRKKQRIEKYF